MMDQPSILIIDENQARAAIIRDGLQEAGHADVRWLRETGNLLKQIAEIDPDVIIIDIMLPDMLGFDVAQRLRQDSRFERTPIMFMTGT